MATLLKLSSSSLLSDLSLINCNSAFSYYSSAATAAERSSICNFSWHFFWHIFTCLSMLYNFIWYEQMRHTYSVSFISRVYSLHNTSQYRVKDYNSSATGFCDKASSTSLINFSSKSSESLLLALPGVLLRFLSERMFFFLRPPEGASLQRVYSW